jgi:hypothetical protein
MATLTLPVPVLRWPPPSPQPEIESPVEVAEGSITYPDGAPLPADDVLKLGAFVYRLAGGAEEIWDEAGQQWQPAPADPAALGGLGPLPLSFKAGDPQPWQGVIVALGQKDRTGADRFATAVAGLPRYHVRVFASARRAGVEHTGLSGASTAFLFASAADSQRFAVILAPRNPRECETARIELKGAALQPAAFVELRASGSAVEIANCDGMGGVLARIQLTAAGDIQLQPAAGRRIVLAGELEADLVHYRPQGSATKVYL